MRTARGLLAASAVVLTAVTGLTAAADTASAATSPNVRRHTTVTASTSVTASSTGVHRHATVHARLAAVRPTVQTQAIVSAVRSSDAVAGVPASAYSVTDVKISGSWARATLTPKKITELDPATVVLRRVGGVWKLKDLGSFEVGCAIAPAATITSLGLVCP